jgi:hypothetical protein
MPSPDAMTRFCRRFPAHVLLIGVLLTTPAAAFEPHGDPAEFNYLVPIEDEQAFTVQQMYQMEEVDGILRHLSRLAKEDPDNPDVWEALCQWIYLKWRKLREPADQLEVIRVGKRAAARLSKTAPDSPRAHVFTAMMPGLESLSKGILDSLHAAPTIRENARALVREEIDYCRAYGYWVLGRLY